MPSRGRPVFQTLQPRDSAEQPGAKLSFVTGMSADPDARYTEQITMPLDLSDTLVVGITSTALFDLSEADSIFKKNYDKNPERAIEEYRIYTEAHETEPLEAGTGLPLVKALMSLNEFQPQDESPIVQIVVMSRNSPETGIRVFHNIRLQGLDITRSAFTGGESVVE